MDHFGGGAIQLGTVNLERAVEVEGDVAVGANECQRLSFDDTEVRGVTQIIALPGIAIDEQHIEAGFRHRPDETRSAIVSDHVHSVAEVSQMALEHIAKLDSCYQVQLLSVEMIARTASASESARRNERQ
jgi:hypothetical protein